MNFSANMRPSPNAAFASLVARSKPSRHSASLRAMRMPLPPPPAEALSITGIADVARDLHRMSCALDHAGEAGDDGNAGLLRQQLGGDLVAHAPDGVRTRADEHDAGLLQRLGECRPLRQEAEAGVDGFRPRLPAGRDDALGDEVTLGRGCRADVDRLVGEAHVQRVTIGIGIYGDRPDPHASGRADDAAGDLAAVRDEDLLEHVRCDSCARSGLERNIAVLAPGILQFLVAQHGERAADAGPGGVGHDHVVDEAARAGDERVGEFLPVLLGSRRDRRPGRRCPCGR